MAKKLTFRGKEIEELKKMSIAEFVELVPANLRRSFKRGLTHPQQKLLDKLKKGKKNLKTHARNMIVVPQMVGHTLGIHSGKAFVEINITIEMLGLRLGDLVMTRQKVQHSAPGIGATKGTAAASVK